MTTVVPKVAGVERVVACAPPISPEGIAPAMIYAMRAGEPTRSLHRRRPRPGRPRLRDRGGGARRHDRRRRQRLRRRGQAPALRQGRIDLLAGPTETCIVADETADPELLATDIAASSSTARTSVGWLVSLSAEVAERTRG